MLKLISRILRRLGGYDVIGIFICHLRRLGISFGDAFNEDLKRRSAIHIAALLGALAVVGFHEGNQGDLHFINGFEPQATAFNAEVFVEQRAVQSFNDTVGVAV